MADNRDLDALVDEALASYTAAEPDPALRARIMAYAAEVRPRPKRLWLLAPAAICAAALAIAFLSQATRSEIVQEHPDLCPWPLSEREINSASTKL